MTQRRARASAGGRFAGAAAGIAMLLVTACSSVPQTYFHTLLPAPPAVDKPVVPAGPLAWEVLPVGIPAQVDQPQWVVRTADDNLAVLEQQRWIAPLADEFCAVVTAQISQIVGPPLPKPVVAAGDSWRVRLDVQRFDSAPGRYARIDATWTISSSAEGAAALTCRGVFTEAVGPGFPALATGHQKAVGRLAVTIGEELRGLAAGKRVGCFE
jgi:uncharacterized protein